MNDSIGNTQRGGYSYPALRAFRLILALVCIFALAGTHAAYAATPTFVANSVDDAVDANPGDGLCLTSSGVCTLRAAIQEANALGSGVVVLLSGATYTLTIKGAGEDNAATGDLDVKGLISFRPSGPGAAVVRGGSNWNDRIFDIFFGGGGKEVSLDGIEIQGGNPSGPGGGIRINAGAALGLADSKVSGNQATQGGGIFNAGTLFISVCTISANHASTGGGGIYNSSDLQIGFSTVSGNVAESKGVQAQGGGIVNNVSAKLAQSTISGNKATGNGGGIFNTSFLLVNGVTIAQNIADSDGDGIGDGGGIGNIGSQFTLANTIVGTNVDLSPSSKAPDCLGILISQGYNLIQSTAGCTIGGVTTGNILGRDPVLGPLQNNGGTTFTHALLFGWETGNPRSPSSPAIDGGAPAGSTAPCGATDQRGAGHFLDGDGNGLAGCDIGAYEKQALAQITLGTFSLEPGEATVAAGEHLQYRFAWTVPGPGWRTLDNLQFVILNEERVVIWVRFRDVAGSPGTFSLVDPENGNIGPAFEPASPNRLETEAATLYLAGSAVDGPPGPRVTLTLDMSFKPPAAGRTYTVAVLATNDAGQAQGFTAAGSLAIQ